MLMIFCEYCINPICDTNKSTSLELKSKFRKCEIVFALKISYESLLGKKNQQQKWKAEYAF